MNKRFTWIFAIILVLCFSIGFVSIKSLQSAAKPTVATVKANGEGSKITLKGIIANDGGKEIKQYGFKWGTNKSLSETKTLGSSINSKSFSTNISGLKAGTTYYYQAYAINKKGAAYGDIKSFTVPAKKQNTAHKVDNSPSTDAEKSAVKLAVVQDEQETSKTVASNNYQPVRTTPRETSQVSRSGASTDTSRYPKLSKYKGSYGQFHYRDIGGGRIEIDPLWVQENIVTIKLPGLNQYVQVHKNAADNFIQAFTYIKNGTATINGRQVPLLSLVKTMDGTYVPRHVGWTASRSLSNHSWGAAMDINAADHYRYVDSSEKNDPNLILWEKAFKPAGFSWGNRYSDAMHFEMLD